MVKSTKKKDFSVISSIIYVGIRVMLWEFVVYYLLRNNGEALQTLNSFSVSNSKLVSFMIWSIPIFIVIEGCIEFSKIVINKK